MKTLGTLVAENPNKLFTASKNDVDYELNRVKKGDANKLLMRRISDNQVVEFATSDDGWILSSEFETPDEMTQLKADKYTEFEAQYQGLISLFSGGYSHEEMLSWGIQIDEAEQYNADNNAVVPFLSNLANARNKSKGEMQLRIRKKAASYKYGTSILIGERQRCEDLLALATTPAEVAAIQYTLPPTFWDDVQAQSDAVT